MVSRLRRITTTSPSSYDTNERKSPKRRFFFHKTRKEEEKAEALTETLQQTHIIPIARVPIEPAVEQTAVVPKPTTTTLCHTSPLLFHFCGRRNPQDAILIEEEESVPQIPDDPTVEESIECVIAASQGELADLLKESVEFPVTPSLLQQSLLKNRSFERMPQQFQTEARHRSPQGAYRSVPYDNPAAVLPEVEAPCPTSPQAVELWPQRPLLMRPTPLSGTIIRGVRFANAQEYLWTPDSPHSWMAAISNKDEYQPCDCLPINSGDETTALVTDFESELFIGSLLLRLRGAPSVFEDRLPQGYFHGLNRRYQVVIRGKFKREIPWTECFTGFQYVKEQNHNE